ncbi:MAG: 3-phosphoshikimate 1-carboxyvinyltransferase [Eubacteriales bacterium]|nr:3-phosphoshikimate 1-carboxyvinyltransferase [Eubacteriales bacterium]
MKQVICPGPLQGTVQVPPSKSISHRALLCAAFAPGVSHIENLGVSDDIARTADALDAMGGQIRLTRQGDRQSALVLPGQFGSLPRIDCGESGSTLRFLLPAALALCGGGTFYGRGRLMQRPLDIYQSLFTRRGILWRTQRDGAVCVEGTLPGGGYALPGGVSSQFVSGLMMALPLTGKDWHIRVEGTLESRPYVEMTRQMMERFGVRVVATAGEYIGIAQSYRPCSLDVEGDWSQAAFFIAAGVLSGDITIGGLAHRTLQGDRAMLDALTLCGAAYEQTGDGLRIAACAAPRPFTFDIAQCPDLAPALAVMMLRGGGTLTGCRRLRMKESDRVQAIVALITALGGTAEEEGDAITVAAHQSLPGGIVDSHNDHRIAMAAAAASVVCRGNVTVENAQAVDKSYPAFWQDFTSLGGSLI